MKGQITIPIKIFKTLEILYDTSNFQDKITGFTISFGLEKYDDEGLLIESDFIKVEMIDQTLGDSKKSEES